MLFLHAVSLMMVSLKLVEKFLNTKVETILSCWACSAKNTITGFSPK